MRPATAMEPASNSSTSTIFVPIQGNAVPPNAADILPETKSRKKQNFAFDQEAEVDPFTGPQQDGGSGERRGERDGPFVAPAPRFGRAAPSPARKRRAAECVRSSALAR